VVRVGEEIPGTHIGDLVAHFKKIMQVTRSCSGITGHKQNVLCPGTGHRTTDFFASSGSWRISDDDLRTPQFPIEFTHRRSITVANKSVKIKGTSPDDIRDSLDQIIKTYKKANKKITNKKVKAAFTPLIEDLEKLRDATKSPGASTGGPDLMTDMSNHGKALNDLCGFDWGTGQ